MLNYVYMAVSLTVSQCYSVVHTLLNGNVQLRVLMFVFTFQTCTSVALQTTKNSTGLLSSIGHGRANLLTADGDFFHLS